MQSLKENIEAIKDALGESSSTIIKNVYMGKDNPVQAALIYTEALADKNIIDRDILNPLMLYIHEDISDKPHIADYLSKKYIPMSDSAIESNIEKAADAIKRGKACIFIENSSDFIVLGTTGGEYRQIGEPEYETSIRGSREGFVENIGTNVSLFRRRIKDKNLKIEYLKAGRRSQTDIAIVYIEDVVNREVLDMVRDRISKIDSDGIVGSGMFTQLIERMPYSIFPQSFSTERADIAEANILEGKVAVIVDGTSHVRTAPTTIFEFYQAVEDYNQRTIIANFSRLLRIMATIIVLVAPATYLTFTNFNVELLPVKFVTPIANARKGIALPPFLEIFAMQLTIELLREGGLWLPTKIAQTLSIVGGIIIGEMAIQSKFVSPTTLLVVGFTTIASFLIPKYDMSLVIRLLGFAMLVIASLLGVFGIAAFSFFLLSYLSALESYGQPYMEFRLSDMKDIFIRAPLWKMNKRPSIVSANDSIRQTDFRKNIDYDNSNKGKSNNKDNI